jgi:hypothetical protein
LWRERAIEARTEKGVAESRDELHFGIAIQQSVHKLIHPDIQQRPEKLHPTRGGLSTQLQFCSEPDDFMLMCNSMKNGAWRSLVARYFGVVEVVGSNPAAPIDF